MNSDGDLLWEIVPVNGGVGMITYHARKGEPAAGR